MSVAPLPSSAVIVPGGDAGHIFRPVRSTGGVIARFAANATRTYLATARESDGYRMRCPKTTTGFEAVLINTGGGVLGGDCNVFDFDAEPTADVVLTTPGADRIYRAHGESDARVSVTFNVQQNARLAWMPQETILYDGARLRRTLTANIADDARLMVCEILVFGRKDHAEMIGSGSISDTWRITRGGRLVLAENLKLGGDIAKLLSRQSTTAGAHAVATLAYIAPNAEDHLATVRSTLTRHNTRIAASAWDGMIVVRGLSERVDALRHAIANVASRLTGRAVPRVWQT